MHRAGASDDKIKIYTKDSSGVYSILDSNGNPVYYASSDNMINNTLCSDYDSCVTDALNAKASKMAAKGVYCSSITECQSLVYADHNGDVLNVGLKSYASLADLMTGKYIPKRIYTVEEATKLSKETGNTFKLRYK